MRIKLPPDAPPGLRLTRDAHHIPHVSAPDLPTAHWGMGFAHALDRPLQLLMMRILGQGRVAELLDGSDASVEIDRFFRRMNWAGGTEQERVKLQPRTADLVQSYCDGINAALAGRAPWELRLLGYRRPEPWTVHDCIALTRTTGYLTLAESQAEVERFYVEMVQAGIPDEHLAVLFPTARQHVDRAILEQVRLGERVVPESVPWTGAVPRLMASTNWVVDAAPSSTGSALLANDPHLEVNRLPNVWVEQVVELPDDTVIFAGMPGLPAALVGRKKRLAWGATYAFMDAVDSWVEHCRDGRYRRGDDWVEVTRRPEIIKRKKGDPVEYCVNETVHGVLGGDPGPEGYLLATRWAPTDSGAASLEAAAAMWDAQTVDEGRAALGAIESAWSWVLADSTGSIGYQMSGRLPRRHPDANGFAPMPGWDPSFDWKGWVPHEELPRCKDPADGFFVTANQDLNHLGVADPITMPMGDYRARRIAALLAPQSCDLDLFRAIQLDVHSIQADELLAILEPILGDDGNDRLLRDWDRGYDVDSKGATLFESFYSELRVEMFGEAGFGDDVVHHLANSSGIFIDFYQHFDRVLTAPESPWLGERSLEDVYRAAWARARTTSPARWGDSNRVVMLHMLLGGKVPRLFGFDRGPIELRGGRATPHQGQIYSSAGRPTSFAPSLRLVADLGEDVLHTAIAGGPTDRRFKRGYVSGLADWLAGKTKVVARLTPLLLLAALWLPKAATADDDFELDPDSVQEKVIQLVGIGDAGVTATLRWVQRDIPDSVCRYDLDVAWSVDGDERSQRLLDHNRIGGGCGLTLTSDPDGVVLAWPDSSRYADDNAVSHTRFRLDAGGEEFYAAESWGTSAWMTYIAELQALLDQGAFATARELVSANGTSPNGGHTSQDPDFMARFATATHREALRAFQAGRGEAAAALVLELLTECPLWNEDDLGGEPAYVLRLGTPEQPRTARLRATEEHHRVVNDFGFFLAEDGRFELAIELLSQVVQLAPDRTVAYLNLADAQWEAGDRPAAKARYSEYVERMGKTEGVAPRALQRRSR